MQSFSIHTWKDFFKINYSGVSLQRKCIPSCWFARSDFRRRFYLPDLMLCDSELLGGRHLQHACQSVLKVSLPLTFVRDWKAALCFIFVIYLEKQSHMNYTALSILFVFVYLFFFLRNVRLPVRRNRRTVLHHTCWWFSCSSKPGKFNIISKHIAWQLATPFPLLNTTRFNSEIFTGWSLSLLPYHLLMKLCTALKTADSSSLTTVL